MEIPNKIEPTIITIKRSILEKAPVYIIKTFFWGWVTLSCFTWEILSSPSNGGWNTGVIGWT